MTVGLIPRNDVLEHAKDYTSFFYETSQHAPARYGVTAGNFDGAGISHGIIQFNFKSGTVQPLFNHLIDNFPSIVLTAFNNVQADYDTFVDTVKNKTTTDQIAWGNSITLSTNKHKVIEPWATYFTQLGLTSQSIAKQDELCGPYLANAESWKSKYGLWSRRAFGLTFDIAVQAGGISTTTDTNIQNDINALDKTAYTKNDYETEKMRIIANRCADAVSITWREDFRTRKLAIANGNGTVNGTYVDTVPYDLILEPAFDYDVEYGPFPAIRWVRDWANGNTVNPNNYWKELKVITTDGTNLALGKSVTSNAQLVTPANITDNNTATSSYETSNSGPKYVLLDLGASYTNIDRIEVYHYFNDGRTFYGTKTEVSTNGTDWVTLRDSAVSGTYVESSAGLILKSNTYPVNATPAPSLPTFPSFRWVRDWLNGNTVNPNNYWNEIKVMVGTNNIALGILPTSNGTLYNAVRITDGVTTNYAYETAQSGPKYVQIDLGAVHNDVDTIQVIHYYQDGRTHYGTKTEISEDGVTWFSIRDSLYQGTYQETSDGMIFVPSDLPTNFHNPRVGIMELVLPKLSTNPNFQKTNLTFRFDSDVTEYTVRCTGNSPTTGIDCQSGSMDVQTQASKYTVAQASALSVLDFTIIPAYTDIIAEIDYTELFAEGVNRINIYGKNLNGDWTPYTP